MRRALFVASMAMVVMTLLAGCGSNPNPALSTSIASGAGQALTPSVLQPVHSFAGFDGAWARGSLVRSGNTLYGRTSIGGTANNGTVFSVNTDGSQFTRLHDFTAGGQNGAGNQPHHNAMLLAGQALFGAALYGGNLLNGAPDAQSGPGPVPPVFHASGNGTLFTLRTDGTGYTPIKVFDGPPGDACSPHSPPVFSQDGLLLYGMTANGGAKSRGTIHSLDPDGSNFRILYSFDTATGYNPHGQVTFDSTGSLLLGMTRSGGTTGKGAEGAGVIFSFDLLTSQYQVLWTFAAADPANGATNDHGFLTPIGTTLYGTTQLGGAHNEGIVFSMGETGSGFTILHSFGSGSDGKQPYGSLVQVGGWLYGTTQKGGAGGIGTVFRVSPAGTGYEVLASFDAATTGAYPEDNLTPDETGAFLYGQTEAGGAFDPDATLYYGTVFRLKVP